METVRVELGQDGEIAVPGVGVVEGGDSALEIGAGLSEVPHIP